MINSEDVARVAAASRHLPPATGVYLETDFILNLFETVLDYQMNTKAVAKALEHFNSNRWSEVRSVDDLEAVFARFPDDRAGNTALAQYLWGYNLWTRAHQLRELARFFADSGVVDQGSLKTWAQQSDFKRDFEGRIRFAGQRSLSAYALYMDGSTRPRGPRGSISGSNTGVCCAG